MALRRFKDKGWQIDYYSPEGRRVRQVFRTKKEAEAELGKRRSLIAEGRYLDVKRESKTTFDELAGRYVEAFKHQRAFGKGKRGFIKDVLLPRFEGRALSSLTYYDCETLLNDLRAKSTRTKGTRTASTLNKQVGTLRHMLAKAVEWGLLERSPFEKGRSLRQKENNRRLRYLEAEELEKLLAECPRCLPKGKTDWHLRDLVEVAVLTGMRRGELFNLKWSQIAGGFIYITRSKTDEARQVPVSADLEAVLKRIRQRQWASGLKSEHVFTYQGAPVESVKRSFAAACKRAGIADFRFHDLRHTFASHYIMRGGSLKTLQHILGHKNVTMTMRYSHLSKEFAREEIQIMNGLTRPDGQQMVNKRAGAKVATAVSS